MPKEIERKYLVTADDYKSAPRTYYKQGYLSRNAERVVRVRIAGEKAFLTIKGKNAGITRSEYEYEIPIADAEEMLNTLVEGKVIEKYRYVVNYEGFRWEVDEFLGTLKGLVIAEIELQSETIVPPLPKWIGKEVSSDPRYYNSNL